MTQQFTRREFSGAALSGMAAIQFPLSTREWSDVLSPLASAAIAGWVSPRTDASGIPVPLQKYGGQPSWHVDHGDSRSSLKDWTNAHSDREYIRDLGSQTATVAAPAPHVVDGVGSVEHPLSGQTYVNRVDVNVRVGYADPVGDTGGASDDWPGEYGPLASVYAKPDGNTVGVAFEAEKTTLADVRSAVSVDEVSADGSGSTIAVIDTGVNHGPDVFGNRILSASKSFVEDGEPTVEEEGYDAVADGDGHGTWVAACTAANPTDTTYQGMAPAADILALRALNDDGEGSTDDIAAAVLYAVDNGVDVICMSLGSPVYSEELATALETAQDTDVTPCVAAGNDRYASRFVNYPASDTNTVGVGATTTAPPADVESAYFSNVGPHPGSQDFSGGKTAGVEVDIGAPGFEVEAKLPSGTKTLSGTSMATPVVAGVAALGDGINREQLRDTAAPAEKLARSEADRGVLDAAALLSSTAQGTSMTSEAEARDAAYRSESTLRGRAVFRLL